MAGENQTATAPAPAAPNLALDPSMLDAARKEGYSDDEILQQVAKARKSDFSAAQKGGYSSSEILDHLTSLYTPPNKQTEAPGSMQTGPGAPVTVAPPNGMTVRQQAIARAKMKTAGMTQDQKNAYETQELGKQAKDPLNPVAVAGDLLGGEVLGSAIPIAEGAGPVARAGLRAAGGAITGAGTSVPQSVAGQVMSGQNPVAPAQLKETAGNAATAALVGGVAAPAAGALADVGANADAKAAAKTTQAMRESQAASKAAKAATDAEAAKVAQEAIAKQTLRDSARTVSNIAGQASDDGVTVNADKSVFDKFVTKAPKVDQNDFMKNVQPILEKTRQDLGIANITKATPEEVVDYRDAVDEALSDPKYKEYRQPIRDAITQDLQNSLQAPKGAKGTIAKQYKQYSEFPDADSKIPIGSKISNLASKIGNVADDAAAAVKKQQPSSAPVPRFETVPIPTKGVPSIEDVEEKPSLKSKAVGNLKSLMSGPYGSGVKKGLGFLTAGAIGSGIYDLWKGL